MSEPIITIEGLVKDYFLGERRIRVLKGVDLTIHDGEFVILFGPSGSGKTTLLNMIGGLDNVTTGKVNICGLDLATANKDKMANHRSTHIGMVFQDFNLIQAMTAWENVALPLIYQDISLKQRIRKAKTLLSNMGLGNRYNHRPVELSGGEQQRVAIARALINNPGILLIDEPTGNLDSYSANEIMKIIVKLNRQAKRTIVLVTHNPNYLGLADRVVMVQDGQIINEIRDNKNENN